MSAPVSCCHFTALAVVAFMIHAAGCATQSRPLVSIPVPPVVSTSEWGSSASTTDTARRHKITHITLHHGGVTFDPDRNVPDYLRGLQRWSRIEKGWIDVPYHFIIDLKGRIYEGRSIDFAGDTNTEYDPTGHALIEVIGNYELIEPTASQRQSIIQLMSWLAAKYDVPVANIAAHRDYSAQTVCPGKNLYRYLQDGAFQSAVRQNLVAAGKSGI